ncbi:MAG: hypothetical protein PUD79_03380 [Prevotellaceae bacterium]|nr:hypothetical protein [Prevotellaceae bacterium]
MKLTLKFLFSTLLLLVMGATAKAAVGDALTAVSEISNTKCYTISTTRGNLVINTAGTAAASSHKINGTVVNDDASTDEAYGQWALLTFNGQSYYLFNVGLKKFLCADNTLSNDYKTAITIEAHGSQSGNYRFKLIGNSNWLNNNNNGGVYFDSHKGEDDGNRVQIAEAGDFDPTYFNTKYTITYNYKINGETVFSEPFITYLGQTFPTPTKPSYVENSTPGGTITASCNGQTYDIECTTSLPFKFYPEGTAWGSISYWNFLKLHGLYASYDPDNYPNFCPISSTNEEAKKENNAFAFIGDPYNGFRIVNRYAGENYTLSNTNNPWDGNEGGSTYAFMKERNSLTLGSAQGNDVERFFVSKVNATTFYLQIKTYDGAPKAFVEMNDRNNGTNHFLSYWTGGNGSGSYVTIEETAFDLVQTTITWNILDDSDNIVATETLENCVQGNQYTTKYTKNIGATIANPTVTAGLEDQTINTHYTLDGSVIKISPNKENVTWYKMKIEKNSGLYPTFYGNETITDSGTEPTELSMRNCFAFVGTPFGFKLYNKFAGLDTPFGTDISNGLLSITTDENAATLVAEYSPNDGFTDKVMIRNVRFETAYFNDNSGTLGFWNSGYNRSDKGSFFEFTEVSNSELDQLVVLNYNYKNGEDLWYTQKVEASLGASLPSAMTMPYGVTASSTPSGTVTAGTTDYDIPVTYNQGNSGMKFFNNIDEVDTWYNWSKRNAWFNQTTAYVYYIKDAESYDFNSTAELDNAYLWAAIGNPFQFKIVNRMTGFDYYLDNPNIAIGDGNTPTMKQTAGQDYFLYDCTGGAWGDYCFQVLNTGTNTALNGNGTLNYWVANNTLGDNGSQMRWTAVDMAEVRKKAVVKELDDLIQGQVYTITAGGTRGAFVYTENGLSSTFKLSIDVDESSDNQRFLFVEKGGTHYLYSIGAGKFINITGRDENNNRAIAIDGRPANTSLQLLKSRNGGSRITNPTILSIDGHHVGISNGFTPAVITHYNDLTDEGNALCIKPVYGVTIDDMAPIMTLFANWTGLEIAIADAETPEVNMIGTGFGKYTADETFYTSLENAKDLLAATPRVADETTVDNAIASIALSNLSLNMPANGTLLHIKDADNNYMTCNNTSGNRIAFDATKDVNTIFCYTGSALVAYTTGFYASRSSNFPYHMTGVTTESDGTLYHIHASPLTRGKYLISFGGDTRFMYKGADAGDFNGGPTTVNNTNYEFTLEETESIPVSISAAGLATLYSPMALTIPEGVKAYVGDYNSENSTVVLNALEGVIPANTGVIIEGAEGSYDFNTTTTATTATSCLTGSVPAIATPATGVYTLQKVNTKLGLYKYTGANLGAFKAYFQTSGGSNGFSLIVNDDDLTGVDSLTPNTSADNIYRDLQGNIVLYPQKNQIYILNGKKVLKQ